MFASGIKFSTFPKPSLARAIETTIYASLAIVLIGQIFFVTGMSSMANSLAVIAGEIFGAAAVCAWTPVSNLLFNEEDSPRQSAEITDIRQSQPEPRRDQQRAA